MFFWFRLFCVRSPLLTESLLFSFPSGTEMVHFPEFALSVLCIQTEVIGFPHSEINGSLDDYSLPLLIAVFHVLHRLEAPRHSPFALSSLTIKFKFYGQALGQLVLVNQTHYCAYISNLSTWWSTTSLTGKTNLESGFTLRCIQRLSMPNIATRHYCWYNNRYTRGQSVSVLSY